MDILYYFIVLIVCYFLGCIQSAYIIGKFMKKIDIREHGSKNAGASNAFTIMGWKTGVVVAVVDILKCAIPVFILKLLFPDNTLIQVLGGVSVVLGHVFPVFMGFRGGKGTASLMGMALGLHPMLFVVAGLAIIAGSFLSDYIAIGTVVTLLAILTWMIVFDFSMFAIIIYSMIILLSLYKHYVNFKRIYYRTETKMSDVFKV